MLKLCSTLAVLALATPLLAQGTTGQPATAAGQKADPAIARIADAYVAAVNAGDAAKVAELYAENAVDMPPHQKPLKGRTAIRNYYEQMFKGGLAAEFSNLRLQRMESRTEGNVGYETGQYSQRVAPKGAKPFDDTGNYVVILHRVQGDWRVAYAIYNSHTPPGQSAPKQP